MYSIFIVVGVAVVFVVVDDASTVADDKVSVVIVSPVIVVGLSVVDGFGIIETLQ